MKDKEILNKIRNLIKKEQEEAFDSFTQSDFLHHLKKRIETGPEQKSSFFKIYRKPAFALAMVLTVLIIGTILTVNTSTGSQEKKVFDRIKKIFYTSTNFKAETKADKPATLQLSEEEIHRYELTWIFRNALYNLFPRELSRQQLQTIFIRAITLQPGNKNENSFSNPKNSGQLNLEERLNMLLEKKTMINILNKLSEKQKEV